MFTFLDNLHPFLVYLIILVAKIIEVSMMTIRIVYITKDERLIGAIIAFFEVLIWISIVSTVVSNITDDPYKMIVYALGFAMGSFVGSKIENIIGVGNVTIEAIVKEEHGLELIGKLRAEGYAVTKVDADGMNFKRHILLLHVPRKRVKKLVSFIRNNQNNVVITINDIKPIYGGFNIRK